MMESIDQVIEAFEQLHRSYERYCDSPGELNWRGCCRSHDRVVALLRSDAIAKTVDPLIQVAVRDSGGSPEEAWSRIKQPGDDIELIEERLAGRLGFTKKKHKRYCKAAHGTLRRARAENSELPVYVDLAALIGALEELRTTVLEIYEDSKNEGPRKTKKNRRNDARDYAMRRLYNIGIIVANASREHVFGYSFALSVAVGGSREPDRRRVDIPAAEWANKAA